MSKAGKTFRWRIRDQETFPDHLDVSATGGEVIEHYWNKPIWSGMSSWALRQSAANGKAGISVRTTTLPVGVTAEAYAEAP